MTINKDNENKKINAKWFFLARDEKRSFTVNYHVVNAVKLYFDVAELNWSFFGENREERIGPFKIFIYPSEKVDKNEVKAWIHDAPGSKVNILDGGKVEIRGSKVLTDDIPEARVLFPPRSFTAIAQDSNSKMKTKIVEEEIREAGMRKLWDNLGRALPPLMGFGSLMYTAFFIYFLFYPLLSQLSSFKE